MARRSKQQIIEDAFASGKFANEVEVVDGVVSLVNNFKEYGAMVNRERAIPDVRDGLIVVQRRAMMTFHDLHMKPNNLKGSAEFVGSAMRYHPHSDDALYQAVKKLAQPDRHPVPIVEFQGNQGTLHDRGASIRYTYLKPNEAALAMLGHDDESTTRNEIDFHGVPIGKNFNGEYDEVEVMPAMFPNYLINGHDNGIGVGSKTEIPKHNPREVMDLSLHLLKLGNDNIRVSTLLKILPGPDFPTSGEDDEIGVDIIDSKNNGIESYLTNGVGQFIMQAPYHLEEYKRSKKDFGTKIVFDQLPYAVSTEKVRESFDKMQENGLIPDSVQMMVERQVIVDINKYDAEDVLPYLYSYTPLRTNFHAKMLANLPGDTPAVIGAVEAVSEWLDHRKKTVRATSAQKIEAWRDERANAEITLLAIKHARWLTEVSLEHDDPSDLVAEKLEITKEQAQYILTNTTFSRLSDKRKQGLLDKVAALTEKMDFHQQILDDDEALKEEIKRQITAMRKKFGTKRKCRIISAEDDIYSHTPKGAMVKEPPKKGFLAIGENGTVRFALRDNIARSTSDDYFSRMVPTTDAESVFCVTSAGYVGRIPMKDIPREATKINWHMINSGYDLEQGEEILSIHTTKEVENKYLALMTTSGRLKVVDMNRYMDMRSGFKPAVTIDLDKEDAVVGAALFADGDTVGALTSTGKISLYEMVEGDTFKAKGDRARATSFVKLAARGGGEIVWFGVVPEGVEKFVFRTNDSFGAFALDDSAWQNKLNTIGTTVSKITNINWAHPVSNDLDTVCVSSGDFDQRAEVRIDDLVSGPLKKLTEVEGSSEVYAVTYLMALGADEADGEVAEDSQESEDDTDDTDD